jgi:hypothetical protein
MPAIIGIEQLFRSPRFGGGCRADVRAAETGSETGQKEHCVGCAIRKLTSQAAHPTALVQSPQHVAFTYGNSSKLGFEGVQAGG